MKNSVHSARTPASASTRKPTRISAGFIAALSRNLALATLAAIGIGRANAAPLTFEGTTAPTPGDGFSWLDPLNWTDDLLPTSFDDLTFGAGITGPILLGQSQTASSLTFNTSVALGAYGSDLGIALNSGSISVASGSLVSLNANYNGLAGLNLSGGGNLYMGNLSPDFAGNITVDGAGTTLIHKQEGPTNQYNGIGGAQEVGRFDQTSLGFTTAARTITLTNGGEYKILTAGNNSEGNYKNITIGAGGGTLNLAAGYLVQSLDDIGQLANAVGNTFTKAGKGRLTITGAMAPTNPLAGPVVIDGGMIELNSVTSGRFNGITTANTLTINNGGTIFLNAGTAALDIATVIANNGSILGFNGGDHTIGLAAGGSTLTVNGTVSLLNRDLFGPQTQRFIRLHSELNGSGVLQLLGNTNAGGTPRIVIQRATPAATFNGTFRLMENTSLEANPRSNASTAGGTGTVVDTGKLLNNGDIEFAGWGSTLDVRDSNPAAASVLDYSTNEISITTTQVGAVNTISNVRATAATGAGHLFNYGTLTMGNHYLQIQGNNSYQTGFADTASIVGNARIRMNSDASPVVFSNASAIAEDAAGRSITFIKSGQGTTGARDVIIGGNVSISNFNVDFGTVQLRGAGSIGTAFGGAAANILINGGSTSNVANANPTTGLLHLDNNTGHVVGATTVIAAANNNDRISDTAIVTMRGDGILRLTSANTIGTTETVGTININGHNALDVVKIGTAPTPVALTVNTLNVGATATANLTGTTLGIAGNNTSRIVIPGTATGFLGSQFHSANEWAKYDNTVDVLNGIELGVTPFLATDYTINATNSDAAWASGQQLKLTSNNGAILTSDKAVARLNTQFTAGNQNINLAGFVLTVEEGGIISSQSMGFKDGATAAVPSGTAGVTAGTTASAANLFVHANNTVEFHTPIRDNAAGGSVTFVKSGTGTVVLSHQDRAVGAAQVGSGPFTTPTWSSTHTGGWVINDGTLNVHRGQFLGATPTTVTLNGGQLEINHPASNANADSILPGWGHHIVVNGNATVGFDDNGEANDGSTGDRTIALLGSLTINNNSTLSTGAFSGNDIAYLGGVTINGRATFNIVRNDANATTILGGAMTGGGFDLVGYNSTGGSLVIGGSQNDSANNTFNSGIVLLGSTLRLNKANGAIAIPDTADAEDVVINNGATLAWGIGHYGDLTTTNVINNNTFVNGLVPTSPAAVLASGQHQIADTATITLLNGTLGNGDRIQNDTFGGLIMKNGTFNVGLGSLAVGGTATISGGAFNIDRGGSFSAGTLTLQPGAPDLNITTGLPIPGAFTTLGVGAGGLNLSGQNITLGTGTNGLQAGAGAVLKLGGGVTVVGSDLVGGSYGRKGIFIQIGSSFREIGDSRIDLDGGTRDFNIDTDVIFTVTPPIANGGITKSGNGALVLEPYQASTFAGPVTVNAGILQAKGDGAFGTSAGGVTVASGGTVKLDSGWSYGDAFTVSGPGALIPGGDGVREIGALIAESGYNHLTGAVSISGNATLAGSTFLDPSVIPGAGGAPFRIGTLSIESSGGLTGTGNVTLSGPGDGVITNGVNTVGAVIKDGAGRWTVSGASSYAGTTNVLAGVLRVTNSSALGTSGAGTTVAGGGTLEIDGGLNISETFNLQGSGAGIQSGAILSSSGVNTLTGAIVLNGATTVRSNSTLNLTGAITSASDSSLTLTGSGNGTISNSISTGVIGFDGITKSGNGTWTLSGANNIFGATNLRGGTLVLNYATNNNDKVNAGSNLNFSGGDLVVQGHATLSTVQTVAGLDFLAGGAQIAVNGGAALTALDAGSFTRAIGATANFTPGVNGTVVTSTPLTNGIIGGYATAGGTNWATVTGSQVAALSTYTPLDTATGADNAIVSSATLTGAVGVNTLKVTGLGLVAGANGVSAGGILYTGTGAGGIAGTGLISGGSPADELIVNTASGLLDIAAPIIGSGGGSLTKAGDGTLQLSGSSAFTGSINITGGTLSIVGTGGGHPTALGSGTGPRNIHLNGGTFQSIGDYDLVANTVQFVIGSGGGTIRSALGGNISINDATAPGLVPPAQLSGPGDLTFTGGGRYTLSGGTPQFRGYTGKITVESGILTLGHSFSAGGLQEQTLTLKTGSAIINNTGFGLGQNGLPNNIVAESGVEFYGLGGTRAFGGDIKLSGTTTFALVERDNVAQERQLMLNGRVSGAGVTINVVGNGNGNPLYLGSGANDITGTVNLGANAALEVRTPSSIGLNVGDVTVNLNGTNSRLLLRHFQNADYLVNVNVNATSEINSDRLVNYGGGANQLLTINNLTSSTNGILTVGGGNGYTTRVAGAATFSANAILNVTGGSGILFDNGINFTGGANTLDKRGGASVVLRAPSNHTGETIIQGGVVILQDSATLLNTTGIQLRGGELRVDNSALSLANRVNDTAAITLGGGALRITGPETLGNVTATPGVTQVIYNPTSETVVTSLTLNGFTRSVGSILQFQSPDSGVGTIGAATFGNSRVSGRILIPGQADTTQTIPGYLGNNGVDFIQYDGTTLDGGVALGVRDMRNPGTLGAPNNYTDNSAETAWTDAIISRLTNGTDNTTVTNTLTASRGLDAIKIETGGTNRTRTIDLGANNLRIEGAGIVVVNATGTGLIVNGTTGVLTAGPATPGVGTAELFLGGSGGTITVNGLIGDNSGQSVALVKHGATLLTLNNANTYTGGTHINSGNLRVSNGGSLGAAANPINLNGGLLDMFVSGTVANENIAGFGNAIVVNANSTLQLDNGAATTILDTNLAFGAVTINNSHTFVLRGFDSVDATFTGTHTMNGTPTIDMGQQASGSNASVFTFNGEIAGSGFYVASSGNNDNTAGILQIGAGESVANTYTGKLITLPGSNNDDLIIELNKAAGTTAITGDIQMDGGVIRHLNDNQIADSSNVVNNRGFLNFNQRDETIASLVMNGGAVLTNVTTGIPARTNVVNITGNVDVNGISNIGTNTGLTVGNNSTLNIGGLLRIGTFGRVHLTEGQTGAVLNLNGGLEMTGSLLSQNTGAGANIIRLSSDVVTLASMHVSRIGAVVDTDTFLDLNGTRSFTVADGGAGLDLVVSTILRNSTAPVATGGLIKDGPGTMQLEGGGAANTYTGPTSVNEGTLVLFKSAGTNTLGNGTGLVTIGDGSGGAGADKVILRNSNQIADTTTVTIASSGLLDLESFNTSETVSSISGSGAIETGPGSVFTVSGPATSVFNGGIRGVGAFIRSGSGATDMAGTSEILGGTSVTGTSTLLVSGSLTGAVTVTSGATIGGTGSIIGTLTVQTGGLLKPGASPGQLDTGSLDLQTGSVSTFEINGTTAGTGYDQINTTGTVTLAGDLVLSLGFTPAEAQVFALVLNDGTDAVNGIFTGYPEGATVASADGFDYVISYMGNADGGAVGNDIILTIPEPGSALLLLGGLGFLAGARRIRRRE